MNIYFKYLKYVRACVRASICIYIHAMHHIIYVYDSPWFNGIKVKLNQWLSICAPMFAHSPLCAHMINYVVCKEMVNISNWHVWPLRGRTTVCWEEWIICQLLFAAICAVRHELQVVHTHTRRQQKNDRKNEKKTNKTEIHMRFVHIIFVCALRNFLLFYLKYSSFSHLSIFIGRNYTFRMR